MPDNITNEKKRNVGFKVLDHEYNILQQYADIFAQQEIEDPITKQRRKLLAKNSISLLFKMLLIHTA
jgi:hypothetical protein